MTARNWKTWVCGLALACSCSLGLAQGLEYEFREGDFESIYHGSSSSLVIWRWSGNRNVYVFDFPNLTVQGRTFNRVTQLTEQFAEPYKRVLTTPELEQYYFALRRTEANFAFGNDVLVSELVLFFNLARRDKVELYPEELGLRDFLVQQGMMREWRGFYQALTPDVVLLSIPQRQEAQPGEPPVSGWARQNILMHELAHAEYYTNVQYANYCRKFWYQTLNDEERQKFAAFLSKYNYDANRDELLINETQAYLMFTPDKRSFSAEKVGLSQEHLEALRASFRRGSPPTRMPIP